MPMHGESRLASSDSVVSNQAFAPTKEQSYNMSILHATACVSCSGSRHLNGTCQIGTTCSVGPTLVRSQLIRDLPSTKDYKHLLYTRDAWSRLAAPALQPALRQRCRQMPHLPRAEATTKTGKTSVLFVCLGDGSLHLGFLCGNEHGLRAADAQITLQWLVGGFNNTVVDGGSAWESPLYAGGKLYSIQLKA